MLLLNTKILFANNVHAQIGTGLCGNKQEQKRVFGLFLSLGLKRERDRERERKGGDVVCEHKEDRRRIVLFLGVSSKGIKQGFIRERERGKEKAEDKAEGYW